LSSNQTIPSNVDTVIQFSDDFDPNNWWDASTYRFTPTIAGYYNITLQVLINPGTVTNNQYNTQIRKNGNSQEAIWQNQITTSIGLSQGNDKLIYLNGSTDFTIYPLSSVNYKHKKKMLYPFLVLENKKSKFDWDSVELKCNSNVPKDRGGFPEMDGYKWVSLDEAEDLLHDTQVKCLPKIKEIISE
jgi:hypothetical protein